MPVDGITSAKRVDLSRDTFDTAHAYRAVVALQGRVRTEAEENEQRAIDLHRDDVTFRDVIGAGGTPKGNAGFAIALSGADPADLTIAPGRIYVGGILVENPAPASLKQQPFVPSVTLPAPAAPQAYTVVLDVWERDRTFVEDAAIREPALGGPDTTARTQVVWQVSLVDPNAPAPPLPGGTLTVQTNPAIAARPCALPPTAGYLGLENQLYRVEIHTGGAPGTASFKWSRENGAVVSAITSNPIGATFTVASLGPDATLGFGANQWIELLDDGYELARTPGQLLNVRTTTPASSTVAVDLPAGQTAPTVSPALKPKIRRWDHRAGAGADGAILIPADGKPVPLENGIQVTFTGALFTPGSYWLVPARTAIDETGGNFAIDVTQPLPVRYVPVRRTTLGTVTFDGKAFTAPGDGRHPFPPLTAIAASDVSYVPGCPDLAGTSTVQAAIDTLCATRRGSCSLEVTPGPNWDAPIRALIATSTAAAPVDLNICLAVGDFPLASTLTFANLGSVKLTGSGKGTHIHYDAGAVAVQFTACSVVDVRDLRIDGGTLPPVPPPPPPNPGAANDAGITFVQRAALRDVSALVQPGITMLARPRADLIGALGPVSVFQPGTPPAIGQPAPGQPGPGVPPPDPGTLAPLPSALASQADFGQTWYVDETMSGTLTIATCGDVRLERLWLSCLGNATGNRLTTSVTVSTGAGGTPATSVRVRDCDVRVGDGQLGMLFLNVTRGTVEDNAVVTAPTPRNTDLTRADPATVSRWASLLIGKGAVATGNLAGNPKADEIAIDSVDGSVHVQTYPELRTMWTDVLGSTKRSAAETYGTMQDVARKLVVDPAFRNRYQQLDTILRTAQSGDVATGGRGIAFGGSAPSHVRVTGNAVLGFASPIAIGNAVSYIPTPAMAAIDVIGNRVTCRNPSVSPFPSANGITAAAAQRCLIADNEVIREGTRAYDDYGITMQAFAGDYVVLRANRFEGFQRAIEFNPINYNNAPAPHMWRAQDNLATPAGTEYYLESMENLGNV